MRGPRLPDDEAFRLAFAHSTSAVAVVTGAAHTLVYANEPFHKLSDALVSADGAAQGAVVLGTPLPAAFPAATARALRVMLDGVRARGTAEQAMISIAQGSDAGRGDAWPCTAWPVAAADACAPAAVPPPRIVVALDASAMAARARARHRDVTERVLLSAFREEARADDADAARAVAEEANAARGRFLATTSHELRTPLQAIGGYAELLELGLRGPVTDGQRDALGRIQQAMQHLLTLTTALLAHTQIEVGQLVYTVTDVPVAAALRDAAILLEPQAGTKGLTLTVAPGDAGLVVRADGVKMRQVLLNLLANAVKFTAGGDVTIAGSIANPTDGLSEARVDGSTAASSGGTAASARVAIRVSDTGCGIAADQLTAVFDPYVQVGRRLTTRDAGVGLGLAISRELARGMGGDLTVESTLGVGSIFTLTLPAG